MAFQKLLSETLSECQKGLDPDQDCQSWFESKLFTKVMSRQQRSPIARKELRICGSIPDILSEVAGHHKLCHILLDDVWLYVACNTPIRDKTFKTVNKPKSA